MSLHSWDIKILLAINGLQGKNRWLDAFSRAGAEWVVAAMMVWYGVVTAIALYPSKRHIALVVLLFAGSWSVAFCLSNIIGLILRRPRPFVTHPEVKLMFHPMESWKTFPSDHTMTAALIVFLVCILHLPFTAGLWPLLVWVAWGRVFAGVHYPSDILGGLTVAGLVSGALFLLLSNGIIVL